MGSEFRCLDLSPDHNGTLESPMAVPQVHLPRIQVRTQDQSQRVAEGTGYVFPVLGLAWHENVMYGFPALLLYDAQPIAETPPMTHTRSSQHLLCTGHYQSLPTYSMNLEGVMQ